MIKKMKYYLIIVIMLILIMWFPFFQSFLTINQDPKKSDVVIVLSGDTERLEKAAKLYHTGYAKQVMLSTATEAGTTPKEAVALNVLEKDLILENKATSTYTNALYTKEKMKENKLDSAIVVSSDYHMRRVNLVFERVYNDSDIELTYVSSSCKNHIKDHDSNNMLVTMREYVKLIGYWLGLYKFIDL